MPTPTEGEPHTPKWVWTVLPYVVAAVVGYFSGQLSAENRMTRVETLLDYIRMDVQGVRGEIMAILKERR